MLDVNYKTFAIFVDPWYLTGYGADDLYCGQNKDLPCGTLSWLLTLAYKKKHKTSIHIVTDTDLIFNFSIVVKYIS